MARIPEHEIERLKDEVSVQRLAEARGIKLVGNTGVGPAEDTWMLQDGENSR
jgi:hypothetical protein